MLKKLNNMKVKPKLIICFVLVVCIASISGILGAILLLRSDNNYSKALIENGFSQGEIGAFNTYLNKDGAVVRDIILLTDATELAASQEELKQYDAIMKDSLEKLKKNCATPKELEIIAIIDQNLPSYEKIRDEAIDLGLQNKNDEALAKFRNEARPVLAKVMKAADDLAALNVTMGAEVSENLTGQSRITIILIIAVIIAAVIISLIFAVYMAKALAEPLVRIKEVSVKLAQGQMDTNIQAVYKDEIGEMTESFKEAMDMLKSYIEELTRGLGEVAKGNFDIAPTVDFRGEFQALDDAIATIVVSLSQTMHQINESSMQVALGSAQMAESAQSLAEGATDQAGAIEELTATIESVSDLVGTSAVNAKKAYHEAKGFELEAEKSSNEMEELIVAMERISETSKQIENIIGEIEEIASQTNLLSLNASIEAARAGEAGKGFAVVADQIGKLAAESGQSAINTKTLIENSIREIEKGNEITNRTMQSIVTVIEGIKKLAQSSNEISDNAETQADSMKEIEQGIEQISAVIQSNSAAAEETSATSEELSAQSEGLKELVGQFILKKGI